MNKPFHFKQFTIQQAQSAMKVGTDGVLLGAWASLSHEPTRILDIGAGTGLIALMLAQRSNAELVDAIELDGSAYEECVENFESSPWSDRLFCYHAGLDEFVEEMDEVYDLIVCNPPFFETHSGKGTGDRAMDPARIKARHTVSLSFDDLLNACSVLLSEDGQCCFIIPYPSEHSFLSIASGLGLHPHHICHVKGRVNTPVVRSLLSLGREKREVSMDELVIEKKRHEYTDEYIKLTEDFYLRM